MIDARNFVMEWLEICGKLDDCSNCCPYRDDNDSRSCRANLMADAYDVLKAQEPIKPRSVTRHGKTPQIQHFCGNCNAVLYRHKQKYCSECGMAVKWE